jgi:tRNA(adenine34) deaminase
VHRVSGSVTDVLGERRLNHRAELTTGVLADECGEMLREFFRQRRKGALRLADAGELAAPGDEGPEDDGQ